MAEGLFIDGSFTPSCFQTSGSSFRAAEAEWRALGLRECLGDNTRAEKSASQIFKCAEASLFPACVRHMGRSPASQSPLQLILSLGAEIC